MSAAESRTASGKTHRNENFPVASLVIKAEHRPAVMAFYRFARKADDIADHASLPAADKHAQLDLMGRTLRGEDSGDPEARALREALQLRGLTRQHALDLLVAFAQDVDKRRYADWPELMTYCRYSAMPVGRFMLDVHGESQHLWPASDALCAALQVINHLQDFAEDYETLDRVYIPEDAMAAAGCDLAMFSRSPAPPPLRAVIRGLAEQTVQMLDRSRRFADQIIDRRLACEVAIIQRLADDLAGKLYRLEPNSPAVHHTGFERAKLTVMALGTQVFRRRAPDARRRWTA